MLPFLLDALNPLQRSLSEAERALRAFRASCVGVALLALPFGYVLRLGAGEVADPMAMRWTMTAAAVALLVSSFQPWFLARWSCRVNLGLSYLLVGYFCGLAWANEFVNGFSVGLLFVFIATGLAQGLAYTNLRIYARYLAGATGLVLVAIMLSRDFGVPEAVLGLSTVTLAGLLYFTVRARVELLTDLAESESHLAEAQDAAGIGSWEKDLVTGRIRCSQGLLTLTGLNLEAEDDLDVHFSALVHPDDIEAATRDVYEGTGAAPKTIRFQRVGSAAWRFAEVRKSYTYAHDGTLVRVSGIVRDTTDEHARESALHAALLDSEAAAAAKSTFLANMSHEIRTPLTAILGYAELLADEADESQRTLVDPIVVAGERLLATLNSVLDLARMEAGETDLLVQPVDVGGEVSAVARLLAQRASSKGLALRVDVPEMPLVALGDPAALSRVLANLVSNAVKFTSDGEILVRASRCPSDRYVVLDVCDTGRGMTPAFLDHVFEPFRQASTGWARSHEGTGLGLTIVKRLVEGMNGTVSVASTVGAGTCFTVRLPLAPESVFVPAPDVVPDAAALTAREPVAG